MNLAPDLGSQSVLPTWRVVYECIGSVYFETLAGVGNAIISAVREDDSFVDLAAAGRSELRFSSNRPDVVEVSADGLISAQNAGLATVTVSYGGKEASAVFAVRNVPAR